MNTVTNTYDCTALQTKGVHRLWNHSEIANKANEIIPSNEYKDLSSEFWSGRDPFSMSVMLGKLTDTFGEHPIFSYYYGWVWDLLDEKEKAYDCFYDALGLPRWSQLQTCKYKLDDELGYAVYWLAEYRRSLGDIDEAKRTLSMMPSTPASLARENQVWGNVYDAEGKYDLAIDCLSRAYHRLKDVNILLRIAACQMKSGFDSEAVCTYIEGLAAATGNNALLLYGLGYVWMQRGQIDSAIIAFQGSHELVPDFAATPNNIAYLLALQSKPDEARKYAEMALALDSSNADNHDTMAHVHLVAGQNELALEAALKAISIDWWHAEAWFHAGVANWRLGNHSRAHEIFHKLMSMDLAWAGWLAAEMNLAQPKPDDMRAG